MKQTGPGSRTTEGTPTFAEGIFQAKGCANSWEAPESRVCERNQCNLSERWTRGSPCWVEWGALNWAGVSSTLWATRFSKSALGQAQHKTLNYYCTALRVQLISWISLQLCDFWPLLQKMNNLMPGLLLLSRSNSIQLNKYLLSASYVQGSAKARERKDASVTTAF